MNRFIGWTEGEKIRNIEEFEKKFDDLFRNCTKNILEEEK